MDPSPRFSNVASTMQSTALSHLDPASTTLSPLPLLSTWKQNPTHLLSSTYDSTTAAYLTPAHDDGASPFLGRASRSLYDFVRRELKVPFLTERGLNKGLSDGIVDGDKGQYVGKRGRETIGDYIAVLHAAIWQGVLFVPIMEALKEVQTECGEERDDGVARV